MGSNIGDKRTIFEKEILQSSTLSYNNKKELFFKIVNKSELLSGKKKSKLQKYLKDIMEWRNAFAHGLIQVDNIQGCFVNYYSGSPKMLNLTNDYWDTVESTFKDCHSFIAEINEKLMKIDKSKNSVL